MVGRAAAYNGRVHSIDREAWKERVRAWKRYARWQPPESPKERESRSAWLDAVYRIARERGLFGDDPVDSPEIRARRERIRKGLASIHA